MLELSLGGSPLLYPGLLTLTSSYTVDFYLRQNAQKKADRAKEHETKVGLYKNNMYKGSL